MFFIGPFKIKVLNFPSCPVFLIVQTENKSQTKIQIKTSFIKATSVIVLKNIFYIYFLCYV